MPRASHPTLEACPSPAARRITLRVTAAAEGMLRHGHPWLYDQAIHRQSHDGQPGDLAVVFDRDRRFLAIGLYDPDSAIRVRVLQHRKPALIDRAWFEARIEAAARIRDPLVAAKTSGYRVVHGENDGLPGLVIDRYDETFVVKLYTAAWVPHLRDVVAALCAVCAPQRVVLRASRIVLLRPDRLHGLADGATLVGQARSGPVLFVENGLRFEADPIHGHKTGFFFDQRENRERVGHLSAGRSVLDAFAYTGGFSVYAARGRAREVTTLDASRPALAAARRNMAHNRRHQAVAAALHRIVLGDVFETLDRWRCGDARFDVVVLDPPAFSKTRDETRTALAAYGRLARLGLGVLAPGGTLMISSCSSHISAERFFETVHRAAQREGRPLRELERTGHALDHPIGFPEGAYLKCLFAVASSPSRPSRR